MPHAHPSPDPYRAHDLYTVVAAMRVERDRVRFTFGDKYRARIEPYIDRLWARMRAHEQNPLDAMLALVEADDPSNIVVRGWLVSAAVEIIADGGWRGQPITPKPARASVPA